MKLKKNSTFGWKTSHSILFHGCVFSTRNNNKLAQFSCQVSFIFQSVFGNDTELAKICEFVSNWHKVQQTSAPREAEYKYGLSICV